MRIVSLLPSATEIVCALGLREQLVGVTHECDYPLDVASLPRVTTSHIPPDASSAAIDAMVRDQLQTKASLYALDAVKFASLAPDLVITQSLCNVCAVAEDEVRDAIESLPSTPKLVNLNPHNLESVLDNICEVAIAAGCELRGRELVASLRARIDAVEQRSAKLVERPTVMLLEWIDPPFSAGHWNPELVRLAGGVEVIGKAGERSTQVAWDDIRKANPDVMVIACCGFTIERSRQDIPLLQSYAGWDELDCVKSNRVYVVDGSAFFSRPGPRLVDSLEILANLVHPDPQLSFSDESRFFQVEC